MMRTGFLLLVVAMLLAAVPALAGEGAESGFLKDFLTDFDRTSKRLVDLAEAIPADVYDWRPTDEVRTLSQVYMHVASTNYFLARDLGVALPEELPDLEQEVTAKDGVIEWLKRSQDQIRKAVAQTDGDVDREMELFGRQRSVRSVYMIVAGHSMQHLGQLIVYARSNDVVPPWSR